MLPMNWKSITLKWTLASGTMTKLHTAPNLFYVFPFYAVPLYIGMLFYCTTGCSIMAAAHCTVCWMNAHNDRVILYMCRVMNTSLFIACPGLSPCPECKVWLLHCVPVKMFLLLLNWITELLLNILQIIWFLSCTKCILLRSLHWTSEIIKTIWHFKKTVKKIINEFEWNKQGF